MMPIPAFFEEKLKKTPDFLKVIILLMKTDASGCDHSIFLGRKTNYKIDYKKFHHTYKTILPISQKLKNHELLINFNLNLAFFTHDSLF